MKFIFDNFRKLREVFIPYFSNCTTSLTINHLIIFKILQRTNFNIINILLNILRLVAEIIMILKLTLCNILVTDFFDYLLLIMFDNEFVTEKIKFDLTLSEIYRMIYYFSCYM